MDIAKGLSCPKKIDKAIVESKKYIELKLAFIQRTSLDIEDSLQAVLIYRDNEKTAYEDLEKQREILKVLKNKQA